MKKVICLLLLLSLFTLSLLSCSKEASDYRQAKALLERGELAKAYDLLLALGDYKDAEELLERFHFIPAEGSFQAFSAEGEELLLGYEHTFAYNEKGLLTNYCRGSDATSYTYDEQGYLLEERFTNAHDTYLTSYTYDERGNRIKMSRGYSDKVEYYEEYTYDEKGNLLTETHFSEDPNAADLPFELPLRPLTATPSAKNNLARSEGIASVSEDMSSPYFS